MCVMYACMRCILMQIEYDLAKARFVLAKIIQDLVPVTSAEKKGKVNSNLNYYSQHN